MKPFLRWLWLAIFSATLAACTTPQASAKYSSREAKAPGSNSKYAKTNGAYYPGETPTRLNQVPDAIPVDEPLHRSANRSYVALGKSYTPDTSGKPYRAAGTASWYGNQFHGRRTSSGEKYDMYAMTGAHPTLPIPSYARVTNTRNGKSVIVRINDRGPFHKNRLIDLSYAAASRLGYVDNGNARVVVERVWPDDGVGQVTAVADAKPAARSPMLASVAATDTGDGPTWLQLGSYGSKANAEAQRVRMLATLASEDLDGDVEVVHRDGAYKVRLGPFLSTGRARETADRLKIQTVVMR